MHRSRPQLLTVAIANLVQNALKYSLPYTVLDISSNQLTHNVSIIVINTGMGINASKVSLVFEQFYKGKNAGLAKDGAGLGLALSQK